MVNYENDYVWGEGQQRRLFNILEQKWNGIIGQPRFAKYDFISETTNIEMKSRKNLYKNSYDTTLLTMNKITNTKKDTIFLFNFVFDVLSDFCEVYYIKYDKERFSKYAVAPFSRAKLKNDEKDYIYIPVSDLTFLYRDDVSKGKCLLLNRPSLLQSV